MDQYENQLSTKVTRPHPNGSPGSLISVSHQVRLAESHGDVAASCCYCLKKNVVKKASKGMFQITSVNGNQFVPLVTDRNSADM